MIFKPDGVFVSHDELHNLLTFLRIESQRASLESQKKTAPKKTVTTLRRSKHLRAK